eukprot:307639-Rhodomonas_salina.1
MQKVSDTSSTSSPRDSRDTSSTSSTRARAASHLATLAQRMPHVARACRLVLRAELLPTAHAMLTEHVRKTLF